MIHNMTPEDERRFAEQQADYEREYAAFMAMDGATKHRLVEAWTTYFKKVAEESPIAKNFFAMKQAFKEGNMKLVRELTAKNKTLKSDANRDQSWLPKPSKYDPLFLVNKHRTQSKSRPSKPVFSREEKDVRDAFL